MFSLKLPLALDRLSTLAVVTPARQRFEVAVGDGSP
jgi:hypothetical protein